MGQRTVHIPQMLKTRFLTIFSPMLFFMLITANMQSLYENPSPISLRANDWHMVSDHTKTIETKGVSPLGLCLQ